MLPLFFFFLYFATTPATCLSNETDFHALLAFKKAVSIFHGGPHGALGSWNGSVHFCNWEGILCSRRHRNRVESIDLNSQNLSGLLSPHLGNLSFLRSINLQSNYFIGEIPEELGRLRQLEWVEFSQNIFTGGIPRNLSQCKNLFYLNLINNYLTGPVIPELGSLTKFQALGLSINNLSGTIPPFLGNLTSLVQLSLSQCGLRGEIPESLSQLRSLGLIDLSFNNFNSGIPSGLYNISSITVFAMGSNQLHGKIPTDLGLTLPKLTIFDLSSNYFDGPVPSSLSNASFLQSIYLYSNKFTGPMLKDFHRLSDLQELLIHSNSLEGDISFISSMTNCTNLLMISVMSNRLSGSLPDSIGNLSTQLNSLYIGDNRIHGNIPAGIQNLVGLTRITCEGNFLGGPIPIGIGKLSKVQVIDLQANQLTNEIPSSLGNLTLLNTIALDYNNLVGKIPQSLSNCTALTFLALSVNNLTGSIPRDIISLSSISISFHLAYNAFTGSIPLEVGSLNNLEDLDLSYNRLSGVIPSTLGSCLSLGRLHLENNFLEGQIPDALNALKGLEDLDLSQNNLSGLIPSFLANELKLNSLNLSFNRLQGEVPTRGVFQNESAFSVEGNEYLCGGLAFLKLPVCASTTNSKKKHSSNLLKVLIPVLGAGGISFAFSCVYMFVYRRRILRKIHSLMPSFEDMFLRLSYADLLKATDGFSEANLLGSGRFGSVYGGILDDKQLSIAVKVLNLQIRGAAKSFATECNVLKATRHRNLLKILSVCESIDFQGIDFMALVYELMDNGSMEKWLHNDYAQEAGHPQSESNRHLSITQKLSIAIDIASAVEYLHHGTDSIVIHGDLKPSNILLDENMTAHVGDFGLAKVVSNIFPAYDGSSSSIAIKGTIGYIPPEYGMSNNMTTQGDLYSFGILVLEMFTNIRPTNDSELSCQSSLHHLVSHALQNQEMNIIDQTIPHEDRGNSKIRNCVCCVLEIGVACSMELPKDRMTMTDVVRDLNDIQKAYLSE
ncbi:LOW QUALITY PROTEIN: uncharacterized protein [Primulina eburnea]|uniref:LOW QUALITY PROTEIN: uncharacterized protein n=1 Tax=Primulina eburnea TaxID=1245227 RepID=UPI003C6CBA0D